jgi:hypothetical protein
MQAAIFLVYCLLKISTFRLAYSYRLAFQQHSLAMHCNTLVSEMSNSTGNKTSSQFIRAL